MFKERHNFDDAPAPAITPEMLAELKKEDMEQAVVERFRGRTEAQPRSARRAPLRPQAAND